MGWQDSTQAIGAAIDDQCAVWLLQGASCRLKVLARVGQVCRVGCAFARAQMPEAGSGTARSWGLRLGIWYVGRKATGHTGSDRNQRQRQKAAAGAEFRGTSPEGALVVVGMGIEEGGWLPYDPLCSSRGVTAACGWVGGGE